jgi:hypothetical protein
MVFVEDRASPASSEPALFSLVTGPLDCVTLKASTPAELFTIQAASLAVLLCVDEHTDAKAKSSIVYRDRLSASTKANEDLIQGRPAEVSETRTGR